MSENKSAVIMVLYDLPSVTKEERRRYRRFNDMLEREGYIMFQESVYVKLIHNSVNSKSEIEKIKNSAPKNGTINALAITLNDFRNMVNISGKEFKHDIFSAPVLFL